MDDLVVWLRQQLDEDERFARAAGWHRWSLGVMFGTVLAEGNGKTVCRDCREYDAEHIARHDPARTLRDVKAKRWRLDRHEPRHYDDGTSECSHCLETGDDKWPCDEIRADLATYSDRPGYREEEWKP